jgi:hypothetical protein
MDQRVGEIPDIFAMRAFVKALPYMDQNSAIAAAEWMYAISVDPDTWRQADIEFGSAATQRKKGRK